MSASKAAKAVLDANPKTQIIIGIFVLVVLFLIVWGIYKLVHSRKEEEDKNKSIELSKFSNFETSVGWQNELRDYLDPKKGNHIKDVTGPPRKKLVELDKNTALNIAKSIYDAKGVIHDDETAAMTAFNQIPSLSDLKIISAVLTNPSGSYDINETGAITFAISFMDEEQQAKLYDILSSKPKFIFK